MNLTVLKDKWVELVASANKLGFPVPLVRDPKSGTGSVSLTLVFISFNVWIASVVGKIAGHFGGIDPSQCLNMFLACAGLYWGRKFQSDNGKLSLDKEDQNG